MKNTLTYQELKSLFRQREERLAKVPTKPEDHLVGCIVFTEDSFTVPYSLEERTYVVSSNNKAFQPNMGGYSIYASSLDGSDCNVRLEGYMAEEGNGERGWKVDYCYLMNMEV